MSLAPTCKGVKPLVTFLKSKEGSTLTHPSWDILVRDRREGHRLWVGTLRVGSLSHTAAGIGWFVHSATLGIPLYNSWAERVRYDSLADARVAAKAYVIESLGKICGDQP